MALAGVLPLFVSADEGSAGETRRFTVTASRYAFDPDRIEVRQGDHVELVLRSADTIHGLGIEAYGVKVAIPKERVGTTPAQVARGQRGPDDWFIGFNLSRKFY